MAGAKTILDWEAADQIEDLKGQTQAIECEVFPMVAKAIIFNTRRGSEHAKNIQSLREEIDAVPQKTAKAVNGQRRCVKIGSIQFTGYGMNDVIRAFIAIGIGYLILQKHGLLP